MKLTIGHMYPDLLNLYGDRGNILTLAYRLQARNIGYEIKEIKVGQKINFDDIDILFLGGGSDREQKIVAEDLSKRRESLYKAVEDGMVLLSICGGYQLLGKYYKTGTGEIIPGLGILDIWTEAGNKRLIGNIIVETEIKNKKTTLVGFENHSGKTYLGRNVKPLGRVLSGNGNNGEDRLEGAVYKNAYGTYLHGPILPKNPLFSDLLIEKALKRKYGETSLKPLEDELENMAHMSIIKRFLNR